MSERAGLSTKVVLVPGVLALLPEYAGLSDPVAELRAACLEAVGWLTGPVEVVGTDQGRRVAEALLRERGLEVVPGEPRDEASRRAQAPGGPAHLDHRNGSYLVVGNGSACRTEKAPGHLDGRSHAFDQALERALRAPDPAALAAIDEALAGELWADVAGLGVLGRVLAGAGPARVEYADDPFGVQYWVMRWECES
jgi:hypothetical protein